MILILKWLLITAAILVDSFSIWWLHDLQRQSSADPVVGASVAITQAT